MRVRTLIGTVGGLVPCVTHANVWEWCRDWYRRELPGGTDPIVTEEASSRVFRGGGWNVSAGSCRSAFRSRNSPGYRNFYLGFRLARVPSNGSTENQPNLTSQPDKIAPENDAGSVKPVPVIAPFDAEEAQSHQRAWADYLGTPVESTNSIGMEMRLIPPGKFTMGSPPGEEGRRVNEDQVEVTLTKPFYLGTTEVTQKQWQAVMPTQPWQGEDHVKEGSDYPATMVSWNDAMKFCRKLTKQERQIGKLPDGWKYTLPTEAQWEYACRAGTTTRFHFGDEEGRLGEYAWFRGNAKSAGEEDAHKVGQKKPNPWGLYDMHGNAWEWCRDWYTKLPGGTDPEVTKQASNRVYRGGSRGTGVRGCRSANRRGDLPGYQFQVLGFRLARVPSEPTASDSSISSDEKPSAQSATESSETDTGKQKPELAIAPFDAEVAKKRQRQWAEYLDRDAVETNSLGMQLVLIPPGEFTMGSPPGEEHRDDNEDQVEVSLTQPFYLSTTEVTQKQWQAVMQTRPWQGKPFVKEGPDYPASWISWEGAMEFCRKLTEQERQSGDLPEGWKYTLPTEAQWEYACRAGTTTRFHFGDDESRLYDYAWFRGNAHNADDRYPHKGRQKKPNPFGLYDMHGNVGELCRDMYQSDLPGGTDPIVTGRASGWVVRGGGWNISTGGCRSAGRHMNSLGRRLFYGFRLARVPVTN